MLFPSLKVSRNFELVGRVNLDQLEQMKEKEETYTSDEEEKEEEMSPKEEEGGQYCCRRPGRILHPEDSPVWLLHSFPGARELELGNVLGYKTPTILATRKLWAAIFKNAIFPWAKDNREFFPQDLSKASSLVS